MSNNLAEIKISFSTTVTAYANVTPWANIHSSFAQSFPRRKGQDS